MLHLLLPYLWLVTNNHTLQFTSQLATRFATSFIFQVLTTDQEYRRPLSATVQRISTLVFSVKMILISSNSTSSFFRSSSYVSSTSITQRFAS
jgi:hypothetical protein